MDFGNSIDHLIVGLLLFLMSNSLRLLIALIYDSKKKDDDDWTVVFLY